MIRRAWGTKYKAQRTKIGDRNFASKLEASVYQMLQFRERAGEISDIKCQHRVNLIGQVFWRVDFSYIDNATNERCFVEAKGFRTADYEIKKKLWPECRAERLEIWGGSYQRPRLMETIIPKISEGGSGEMPGIGD